MKNTPQNVLLVYEEIPDRAVILYLNGAHLAEAGITYEELASVHGFYQNATDMTETQEKILSKVGEAIFGVYDGEKRESSPALWQSAKIFQTDDEELNREGSPPKIDSGAIVVHCGFAL